MKRLAALVAPALLACAALPAPATAQVASSSAGATQTLVVAKDKSMAFRLTFPVGQVVVAQPDVVELVATTDQSFYIRGKSLGVTNLLVYDRQHRLMQVIDVRVGYDIDSLQADLNTALPKEHIIAANFAGGVLLSGEASSMIAAGRAEEIAERYAPKAVQSDLSIKADEQVMVEVRVLEASRSALKEMGFNLNASETTGFSLVSGQNGLISNSAPMGTIGLTGKIGSVSIDATLQALEQKGVLRTLAKPNLVAMSGQEASFLAGGEFPYPIPGALGQVSIEFKPFGVKLNVTPEVQPNGQIRLKVAPEVSAIDPRTRLEINGFNLPALTVRRASTNVSLRSGQSFAIAGLFQQDYQNAVNQIPWASDIPIIGSLFRSSSWKRDETELVIIVTPKLVTPADKLDQIPLPTANTHESGPLAIEALGATDDKPMTKPVGADPRP